jgi:hypothetical protein
MRRRHQLTLTERDRTNPLGTELSNARTACTNAVSVDVSLVHWSRSGMGRLDKETGSNDRSHGDAGPAYECGPNSR